MKHVLANLTYQPPAMCVVVCDPGKYGQTLLVARAKCPEAGSIDETSVWLEVIDLTKETRAFLRCESVRWESARDGRRIRSLSLSSQRFAKKHKQSRDVFIGAYRNVNYWLRSECAGVAREQACV
jgi:hypothetical protein